MQMPLTLRCIQLMVTSVLRLTLNRVATNLENLEYSGISLNMENSGNSVQPQGKIVTNKVFLVRHSNISVKLGKRDHYDVE